VVTADAAESLGLSDEDTAALISRLCERGFACEVVGGDVPAYVPARPAEKMLVRDVLWAGYRYDESPQEWSGAPGLASAILDVRRRSEAGIATMTVADVIGDAV
jgi:hypothetical protein